LCSGLPFFGEEATTFYCGLGPALIIAAAQFLSRWVEAGK